MAKNYMADVAKMLGVEIGEEFKIDGDELISGRIFKIDETSLLVKEMGNYWGEPDTRLEELLCGDLKIVKLPWKPKCGDLYYYPEVNCKRVQITSFEGYTTDLALIALRMCYRTEAEAQEHFTEDYRKLTGKELEK